MCLSKLTTKRTLTRDKIVYKWMQKGQTKNDGDYYTSPFFQPTSRYFFGELVQATIWRIFKEAFSYSSGSVKATIKAFSYTSGFHCFVKKSEALTNEDLFPADCVLVRCIIPKGAIVQYGKENGYLCYSVVVTPEIIFTWEVPQCV